MARKLHTLTHHIFSLTQSFISSVFYPHLPTVANYLYCPHQNIHLCASSSLLVTFFLFNSLLLLLHFINLFDTHELPSPSTTYTSVTRLCAPSDCALLQPWLLLILVLPGWDLMWGPQYWLHSWTAPILRFHELPFLLHITSSFCPDASMHHWF